MRIISGGQSGVDRAALDVAAVRRLPYGGWCPRGGWAEDFSTPPGVLAHYPRLHETPLADPAQRTAWNVRDSDAILILVDAGGLAASAGTALAQATAVGGGKPLLVVDLVAPDLAAATAWLQAQRATFGADFSLGIGGPRESEAPGIYAKAREFIAAVIDRVDAA